MKQHDAVTWLTPQEAKLLMYGDILGGGGYAADAVRQTVRQGTETWAEAVVTPELRQLAEALGDSPLGLPELAAQEWKPEDGEVIPIALGPEHKPVVIAMAEAAVIYAMNRLDNLDLEINQQVDAATSEVLYDEELTGLITSPGYQEAARERALVEIGDEAVAGQGILACLRGYLYQPRG